MSMFEFLCPSCGHPLLVPEEHAGKHGTCNHCGEHILIQRPVPRHSGMRDPVRALNDLAVPPRSLKELISRVSDFLTTYLACDSQGKVVLFIMDYTAGGLRLAETRGQFSQEFLDDEAFVPLGQCLCGRAAQSGQVLVCEDCFKDPRHDNQWLGMQMHGHYVIPLMHTGQVEGVVTIYTRAGVIADTKRLDLLKKVGEQAGKGLHQFLHTRNKASLI